MYIYLRFELKFNFRLMLNIFLLTASLWKINANIYRVHDWLDSSRVKDSSRSVQLFPLNYWSYVAWDLWNSWRTYWSSISCEQLWFWKCLGMWESLIRCKSRIQSRFYKKRGIHPALLKSTSIMINLKLTH